jgi:hypothetical protein
MKTITVTAAGFITEDPELSKPFSETIDIDQITSVEKSNDGGAAIDFKKGYKWDTLWTVDTVAEINKKLGVSK